MDYDVKSFFRLYIIDIFDPLPSLIGNSIKIIRYSTKCIGHIVIAFVNDTKQYLIKQTC